MPNLNTTSNVAAGKPKIGGAIFRAPVGTALPEDTTTALNAAFECLGYISEDGVKNNDTREVTKVKAWGGETVMSILKSKDDNWNFTLIEATNIEVLKTVYGDSNVSGNLTDGIAISVNAKPTAAYSYVVDMVLGDHAKRVVVPEGKVVEVGEITYTDANAIGYPTTLNCTPDEDGNTHYEYIK